jgi:hypothetical protein
VPAARPGAAVWSVVAGIASVVTMPLAVYLTRFVASYELRDIWLGVPIAAALGAIAIVLSQRGRRQSAVLLGRGGGPRLARAGRILGIAGARVTGGELPVTRAQNAFDDSGRLVDALVGERLRAYLAALAEDARQLPAAA